MAQHDDGRRYDGQQRGHRDHGGGQQDQYGQPSQQQGDNWRDRPGYGRGPEAGRGGQGSFGGQASDNDFGNRGITESGNFGNYGQRGGQDQGGQRDGGYRHGYDARSDSTGGYGNGNGSFRPDNQGSRGGRGPSATWGQSLADNYQGSRGWQESPDNHDRYGDNGYQGNFQQGQRGQAYHDPDYHQWRSEQLSRLDRDYDEWRQHRYQRFSEDFDNWRSNRANQAGDVSGQQSGSSKHDVSNGGDKGAGKTATK